MWIGLLSATSPTCTATSPLAGGVCLAPQALLGPRLQDTWKSETQPWERSARHLHAELAAADEGRQERGALLHGKSKLVLVITRWCGLEALTEAWVPRLHIVQCLSGLNPPFWAQLLLQRQDAGEPWSIVEVIWTFAGRVMSHKIAVVIVLLPAAHHTPCPVSSACT